MPEKEWIVYLGQACRVEVEKITFRGRVTGFRVVLLAEIDGELHCVTRYDTAHGFAHRDVLGFGGKSLDKEVLSVDDDYNAAFELSYKDIISNYEHYLHYYKTH